MARNSKKIDLSPLPLSDMNDDLLLTLQGGVFSLDGSEAIVTTLSVDLTAYLDVHSQTEKPTAKTVSGEDPSRTSSSSSKRRRSMRTFAGIVAGDLSEAAMDAAEKLGIDVAKRLKELGAGPILKAAKDEVEKGREESERIKRQALEKDALQEARRREEEAVAGGGDAEVTKNVSTNS